MNHNLNSTFVDSRSVASMLSSGVLILGIVGALLALSMASPHPSPAHAGSAFDVSSSRPSAELAVATTLVAVVQPAAVDTPPAGGSSVESTTAGAPRTISRRHRQALLMPYFSFGSRG